MIRYQKVIIYHKPDSGKAWIILAASFAIFFLILGSFRCHGIIFVSLIKNFNETREQASWPLVLAGTFMNSSGLAASLLNFYLSSRTIITMGCCISAAALMSCYFAQSISFITIVFGIFHGFGNGLVISQIPSVISQYFVKLRATANGLALAGSTIGSLVLPFLVEIFFLHNHLNYSFLYMGCLLLPTTIFALFMSSPSRSARQSTKTEEDETTTPRSIHKPIENSVSLSLENWQSSVSDELKNTKETEQSLLKCYLKVLSNPHFMLICLTHTVFIWSWSTFFIVIVDFGMDLGNGRQKSILLMTIFSGTDLIGRMFSGLLSDKEIFSRSSLAAIFSATIGVVYIGFSQITSYYVLVILCMILGLAFGGLILLFSVLFVEYLGLERMALAMGTSYFICGLTTLSRPWIIGYFRDSLKSYRGLFILLGVFDLVAAAFWIIEIIRKKCQNPVPPNHACHQVPK